MLVDAARRRSDYYWYLVIFFPMGAWVYFFVVKIHEPEMAWLKNRISFRRPPSVKELRYHLRTAPSFANRVALANALSEQGEHAEAKDLFAQAVKNRPNAPEALHGLGLCELRGGETEAAIEHLAQAVDRDFSFRDYRAALDLAEAFEREGHAEEALDVLSRVVRASPRLRHEVALARLRLSLGDVAGAREGLEHALEDFEHAPRFVKRRDRPSLRDARDLLRAIESTPPSDGPRADVA
jgi:hypothetical protein